MDSKPAAEGLRARHKTDSVGEDSPKPVAEGRGGKVHAQVAAAQVQDVISLLLALRFLNALCVRTFFQPDEYFQALEPAWRIAFGRDSGAWLTWEWQHQLRSSLHPAVFGLAYKAVDSTMAFLQLFPPFRAFILVALPGVLQSVFAALGDFFTWKLAMDIYGTESNAPWAALWMTVLNPWQWYCSTRTFSNSLETTLTIAALCYWPWELVGDAKAGKEVALQQRGRVTSLRISLVLAAIAVLLRPTNLLIWLAILTVSLTRLTLAGESPLKSATLLVLLREIVVCGTAALAVSLASDRLYFGFWTFPPYKWLYFNISQSLAVFYGHMPWHYYLSQGIPLLTTTFLPFSLVGIYRATSSSNTLSGLQSNILGTLSFTLITMVAVLSVISHKEVRFIYPLLPIIHILAAPYITSFFTTPSPTTPNQQPTSSPPPGPVTLRHKPTLAYILSLNLFIAGYLTLFHQPAPLSVLAFLRTDFERLHPDSLAISAATTATETPHDANSSETELFALFLTPCHSTPWRSHLVYPALRARALTCEPPLHTAPGSAARQEYLDEADRFYQKDGGEDGNANGNGNANANATYGVRFLRDEMWPVVGMAEDGGDGEKKRGGEVPRYIVGFEGIEGVLEEFFEGPGGGKGMGVRPRRVWSAWNGAFNEDWRRRGRLVVWDTGFFEGSFREVAKEGSRADEL
ncbi:glycosyltransferase family 22 protein [Trichocladium antarcticum]|uniref:Mannosyltransferase n=1 Tax=Trichocladium antarcticum TaxID=1450529 RepID=A0AAN6USP8_9PEZI|nr:glycosyltransferase family 22 protein [Trichocladium antarcticum]